MGQRVRAVIVCVGLAAYASVGMPAAGVEPSAVPTVSRPTDPSAVSTDAGEGTYVPISPLRVHDARAGVTPGQVTCVQITGASTGIPAGAVGISLNITTVGPVGPGHVVVYPDGDGTGQTPAPLTSTVNFIAGRDVANAALVQLPASGRVCYLVRGSRAGILIDAVGYLLAGSGITLQMPVRIEDRSDITPRTPVTVQVTGHAGVPAGATAVLLNAAVANSSGPGNLRLYPAGAALPTTSTLNYPPGGDRANAAVVQLSAAGALTYWSDTGPANRVRVVLDVVGYTTDGSIYVPVTPTRLLDTRQRVALVAGQRINLPLPTGGPVPADAGAVILNVVGVGPWSVGNLRVYPYRAAFSAPPNASTLNYIPLVDAANMVVTGVGDDQSIALYTDQPIGGQVHVVVDVVGYLTGVAPMPPPTLPPGTKVVGTGTPTSCTSAALALAVRSGGTVTFACGPNPVTITVTETLYTCNTTTCQHPWLDPAANLPVDAMTLDGGGLVTLSGGGVRGIFYANACEEGLGWLSNRCDIDPRPHITFRNIALVDGNAQGAPPGHEGVGGGEGGGAIAIRAGHLTLDHVTFGNNVCMAAQSDGGGGAVRVVGQTIPALIFGSRFENNRCANGGAISSLHASLTVADTQIIGNRATGSGASSGLGGNGGGIYFDGTSESVLVQGTTITGNAAPEGGSGIFYVSNDHSGTLTIEGSTITGNTGETFWTDPYHDIYYLGFGPIRVSTSTIN